MSANIKASVDGTQAIIGVGGVDQMTVSNAGVVTANSFVGAISGNASSATALATGSTTARTLASHFSDFVSPLDFGAVGNGTTDDRAAFKLALESGRPVDGGGRTYGIIGSLQPTSFKGLRNCTLKQLNTASGGANITLRITNIGDFFIDNIKVDRGNNPESNTTNINGFINNESCGITIESTAAYSKNFTISNVEVFGDGSGNGVAILQCEFFTMHNVVVRDMQAKLPDIAITGSAATNKITIPAGQVSNYPDGTVMMFLSLTGGAGLSIGKYYFTKNLVGNTFELSETSGGTTVDFTTDITAGTMPTGFNDDDCLQGIWFSNVSNAKVSNCQVQNLECWASPYNPIGLSPRYGAVRSRGFAMGNVRVSNFVGCQAGNVEQGFDFTGTGEGTNGNRDIVISNCYARGLGSVGFKFANACHDITITGCTTNQSQWVGMVVGGPRQGLSVPERILFNGCSVINTGLMFNDFNRGGVASERPAFYISNDSGGVDFSSPRGIRFMNCTVQDKTGMPIPQFNLEQGKTYRIENSGTTNWTAIGAASTVVGTIFTKNSTAVTGSGGFAAMLPSRTFNANQLAENVKYLITSLGTTNWTAIGADASPAVGEVFTKNGVLATGTGTAVQWGPSTTHGWIDETAPIVYPNFGYQEDWSNQLSNCTSDNGFNLSTGIGPVLGIYGGGVGTTQSLAGATYTNIEWNVNISDLHGLHNSGTNDPNVYIKTTGWYRVNARLTFTSNGTSTGVCGLKLLYNGNSMNDTIVQAQRFTGNPSAPETTKILFMNAGDNVRVQGYQNSGGALNVLTDYSIFQVELI
jgi:hypothetical protein